MSFGTMQGAYIEKGLFCRTATYNPQYNRPLHGNFGQNIPMMMEVTAGGNFSSERLAPIAATSLTLSTQVEKEAGIVGGWNQERCLFALKIVHQSNHAGTMRMVQYLMGYTDYMGIGGAFGMITNGPLPIDPNMRLYFNSNLMFQEMTTINGFGIPEVTITPTEATQLLTGVPGSMHGLSTYTMRPEDLYSMMHTQEMTASANRYTQAHGQAGSSVQVHDGRMMFQAGQPLKKSARANLIPSNYLSRLLSSTDGILATYQNEQQSNQDIANRVSASLSDGYLTNDQAISLFINRTGLMENGSITYGELCQIFPNADSVMGRAGMEAQKVQGSWGSDSEYMNGGDWPVIVAQMLQNVVTALMMDNSLSKIHLTGNNFTGTDHSRGIVAGQFIMNTLGAESFIDGKPIEFACEQIKARLFNEFLIGFTGHQHVPLAFDISVNLAGECVVHISYAGQPMARYVTPMFGDSLFSPILTDNRATLAGLSAETRAMTHGLFNVL